MVLSYGRMRYIYRIVMGKLTQAQILEIATDLVSRGWDFSVGGYCRKCAETSVVRCVDRSNWEWGNWRDHEWSACTSCGTDDPSVADGEFDPSIELELDDPEPYCYEDFEAVFDPYYG